MNVIRGSASMARRNKVAMSLGSTARSDVRNIVMKNSGSTNAAISEGSSSIVWVDRSMPR